VLLTITLSACVTTSDKALHESKGPYLLEYEALAAQGDRNAYTLLGIHYYGGGHADPSSDPIKALAWLYLAEAAGKTDVKFLRQQIEKSASETQRLEAAELFESLKSQYDARPPEGRRRAAEEQLLIAGYGQPDQSELGSLFAGASVTVTGRTGTRTTSSYGADGISRQKTIYSGLDRSKRSDLPESEEWTGYWWVSRDGMFCTWWEFRKKSYTCISVFARGNEVVFVYPDGRHSDPLRVEQGNPSGL
jgi:hypothetical protein